MTIERARRLARKRALDTLATAAIEYASQTSGGGTDQAFAGARLRLAAKQFFQASQTCDAVATSSDLPSH